MRWIILIMIWLSVTIWADYSRSDNIVTDSVTLLQWQDNESIEKSWEEAIEYCEALVLGDNMDWRLPNFNELYSIIDHTKANPAMDPTFLTVVSDYYWSSTTIAGNNNSAWGIYFYDGYGVGNKSSSGYVRCVRSGQ